MKIREVNSLKAEYAISQAKFVGVSKKIVFPSPQIAHRIVKVLGFADKWYKLLEPPESA